MKGSMMKLQLAVCFLISAVATPQMALSAFDNATFKAKVVRIQGNVVTMEIAGKSFKFNRKKLSAHFDHRLIVGDVAQIQVNVADLNPKTE